MVLDCIVGSAGDQFGNLGPLIAPLLVSVVDDSVLLVGPGGFLDLRVEMVVPSLPTLLSDTAGKALSDLGPILGSASRHNLRQDLIFARRPRALREVAAVYEL